MNIRVGNTTMKRYVSIFKEQSLKEGVVDKKVFDILKSLGVFITEQNLKKVNTLFKKNDDRATGFWLFMDQHYKIKSDDKETLGRWMAYVSMLRDKIPLESNMGFSRYILPIRDTFKKSNLTDQQISFIRSEIRKLWTPWQ
jgi:hypothetical protein